MIINSTNITEGGKEFKRVTSNYDYFACAYIGNKVYLKTDWNDDEDLKGATIGGIVSDGNIAFSGFCSDTSDCTLEEAYADLEAEILRIENTVN